MSVTHPPAPTAAGRSMALTAWVTILAPLVAVAIKLASAGWLVVFLVLSSPLWLAGYALLVVCVSRGMLRTQGVLRERRRRVRARIWAWMTSIGVVLAGLTVIDGGDSPGSVQSTLTLLLGAPASSSSLHDLSELIALIAVLAWAVGWVALLVEWAVGAQSRRRAVPRVAPPVVE
ncbi:hypothetical protein AA0Z99_10940 [Agrococcus sp. 1P02AA]|uniref:hypothetical protein n=1 Tax=Agrococcus sp. 1P02AA TaxID=3132259 RepID=UPI0039A467D9